MNCKFIKGIAYKFSSILCGCVATISVHSACTVSVPTPVNFGTYNVFTAAADTAVGTIRVTCSAPPSSYTIALSTGSSASYALRRMVSGANALNYNLYTSLFGASIWGNGTGGSVIVNGALLNGSRNHSVFGQIPALQDVSVGAYSDTIVITVTF